MARGRPRRTAVKEVARRTRRVPVADVPPPRRARQAVAEIPAPTRTRTAVVDVPVVDTSQRPDISRVVDLVVNAVTKQHGEGSVERLNEGPEAVIDWIPTGIPTLDRVLGGGLPVAKLVQIVGPESVGKSALAKLFMKSCQIAGVTPYFIDGEMSKDTPERYAALGISTADVAWTEELYIERAFAKALTAINALKKARKRGMIFIDSIAALQMERVADRVKAGEEFEGTGGRPEKALFLSENLSTLVHALHNTEIGIVFVNQLRQKARAMPFEDPYYEVGGHALRYWCHVILRLNRMGQIKEGDRAIGIKTRVRVRKSKLAPPSTHADLGIFADGRIEEGQWGGFND